MRRLLQLILCEVLVGLAIYPFVPRTTVIDEATLIELEVLHVAEDSVPHLAVEDGRVVVRLRHEAVETTLSDGQYEKDYQISEPSVIIEQSRLVYGDVDPDSKSVGQSLNARLRIGITVIRGMVQVKVLN